MALTKQLNKDYGDGAVFYGEEKMTGLDVVPTGSVLLDDAIGVGGFPRGRIVEVYGPESSGKCLTADTMINTERGLKTIKEIFEENGVTPSCTTKTVEKSVGLVNRHGKIEKTTHFTANGRRNVVTIKTASGAQVRSTQNHPHLVMSKSGNWVWRKAQEISPGDYLVVSRTHGVFGDTKISKNDAYLIGVAIADGHFDENRVTITNDDPTVKDMLLNVGSELFGVIPHVYKKESTIGVNDSQDYHFARQETIREFYERTGLKPCLAKEKEVSKFIRSFDKETMRHFIAGYMDCESSVSHGTIEVTSASRGLLESIKLILLQFGVVASLAEKTVRGYEHNDYYRLSMHGRSAVDYINRIGSVSKKVSEKYKSVLAEAEDKKNTPT